MRRSFVMTMLAAVVCSPLALGADDDDKAPVLDGAWVPSSAEIAGKKLPADAIASWKLVIKDEDYTFTSNEPTDKGTVKVDRSAKPMTMDIKGVDGPNKGRTILAIFELNGDILKVCYDVRGQKRPAEFETKEDTPLFLVLYKRLKP
jgi:uncharacterized protein (TIGR03067 family)